MTAASRWTRIRSPEGCAPLILLTMSGVTQRCEILSLARGRVPGQSSFMEAHRGVARTLALCRKIAGTSAPLPALCIYASSPGDEDMRLEELFLDTLKDIYFAERQILKALPKMTKAAQEPKLKEGFSAHREETEGQVERLGEV